PLYAGVLAVLGVNRFFLSALSAAMPHVVAGDKLVMANSVAPTSGTIAGFLGGFTGLGIHLATGGGRGGSAVTVLAAGACYLVAGTVAATMHRDVLGPDRTAVGQRRAGIVSELRVVAAGLAGVVCGTLGATFSQVPFYVISFALGLAAQSVAITATTIIQRHVDDVFRGRVFSFYDMLFNVPFVIGAAVGAAIMPFDGRSYALVGVAGGGYVLTAVAYSLLSRQRPAGGSPSPPA